MASTFQVLTEATGRKLLWRLQRSGMHLLKSVALVSQLQDVFLHE